MATHSTRCGTGWEHRPPPGVLPPRVRVACHPNHTAAPAKTTFHTLPGSGLSRGTSIPAMATPMATCIPSASNSVSRRHRRERASRPAQ